MHQPPLIALSPPDRCLDRALLEAPGGFLWWYVDLVDERGDGLVLIWSFGLPFLPGYASRARRGRPQMPSERPSLNLSVYRGGTLDFYLLQEYDPNQVSWSDCGTKWRFGDSSIEASIEDTHLSLRAHLNCAVQASPEPLEGSIEIDGVCRRPHPRESDIPGLHDWTPRLGPARGRAQLTHAQHRWNIEGRAYHDRNGSSAPLHKLGIDYWLWGRIPHEDRELIYYLLWANAASSPVCKALSIAADGATEIHDDLEVELGGERKNMGGLVWWETITLSRSAQPWLVIEHTDVVDSGPFYMRYLTKTDGISGIGELVKPDRIDLDMHRPLVRMRVHDLGGDNSMWLPLFTGPKTGRMRRLLASWMPASWVPASWVPASWVPGSWLGGGDR